MNQGDNVVKEFLEEKETLKNARNVANKKLNELRNQKDEEVKKIEQSFEKPIRETWDESQSLDRKIKELQRNCPNRLTHQALRDNRCPLCDYHDFGYGDGSRAHF